jgi:hypothetical protein
MLEVGLVAPASLLSHLRFADAGRQSVGAALCANGSFQWIERGPPRYWWGTGETFEYSLAVYCVSVLLSFAAHAILSMGWNNLASQTLFSVAGIAIMAATAGMFAKINRAADGHPRPL